MSLDSVFSVEGGLPDPLPAEPMKLFQSWFDEAHERKVQPNPNAMTLATADEHGVPSARIVLCKGMDAAEGSVTFYTNRQSRKGRELARGVASVVFHWDVLDRQVRIEGPVEEVSDEESDAYYASRRWESRVGAWASAQSEPLASREALFERITDAIMELDIDLGALMRGEDVVIPRPPFWGGYRLIAQRVELWMGGTGRVHDRAEWIREVTGERGSRQLGAWRSTRLQP